MAEPFGTVFVSSRMEELKEEREAIEQAFRDLKVDTFLFEDVGARDDSIEVIFLEKVKQYDIYLGVFSNTSGKYTEQEYNAAKDLGKPMLLYAKEVPPEERDEALTKFLDDVGKVEGGKRVKEFGDADRLGTLVQQDLVELLRNKIETCPDHFSPTRNGAEGTAAPPKETCPIGSNPPKPEAADRKLREVVGREDERDTVEEAIKGPEPDLTGFFGDHGVGKTLLLRTLAKPFTENLDQYEAGVTYLDADSKSIEDISQDIYKEFCGGGNLACPDTIEEAFAGQRVLLFLDNVDWSEQEIEELRRLTGRATFVLSATDPDYLGEEPVLLEELEDEDAKKLFEAALGVKADEDDEEQQTAVKEICRFAGFNPDRIVSLALMFKTRKYSILDMYGAVQGWSSYPKRLRALFGESPNRKAMMALMAAVDARIPHAVLATALSGDSTTLNEELDFIVNELEVARPGSPRYELAGDLAADLQAEWVDSSTVDDLFAATIPWVERSLPQALVDDHGYIFRLLERGVEEERWSDVLTLARAADPSFMLGGHWQQWRQVIHWAMLAADRLGDDEAVAWAWHQLGSRSIGLRERREAHAHLNEAILRREELGDEEGAALTRHNRMLLPVVVAVALVFWFVALGAAVGSVPDDPQLEIDFGEVQLNQREFETTPLMNPTDEDLTFWVGIDDNSDGRFCLWPDCDDSSDSGEPRGGGAGPTPGQLGVLASLSGDSRAQATQDPAGPCRFDGEHAGRRRVTLTADAPPCALVVGFFTEEEGSFHASLELEPIESGKSWSVGLRAIGKERAGRVVTPTTEGDVEPLPTTGTTTTLGPPGSITIVNNASPSDGTTFAFTGDIGEFEAPPPNAILDLLPRTYSITQIVPSGWDLTISCDDGTSATPSTTAGATATIELDPGESVICVFTNIRNTGTITVDKAFVGTAGLVDLLVDANTEAADVGDSGTTGPVTVDTGSHTAGEAAGTGTDLADYVTTYSCVEDTNAASPINGAATTTAAIPVEGGDAWTCTFTNEEELLPDPGSITIAKRTTPSDGTTFGFTGDLGTFSLGDGQTRRSGPLTPGTYVITETVPSGWRLGALACTDGSLANVNNATVTVSLAPGENVTCSFSNERLGSIHVVVEATPGDDTKFSFTGNLGDFQLSVPSQPERLFVDLERGTYVVNQAVPAGWTLTGLSCGGNATTSLASGTATVILAAAENVTCTFTNTNVPEVLRADITPERVNYPPGGTITVKNIGTGPFTVGNIAAVTPPGFSLASPDGCSGTTLAANATCEFALALVDPGVVALVNVLTGFIPDGVGGDTKVLLVDP